MRSVVVRNVAMHLMSVVAQSLYYVVGLFLRKKLVMVQQGDLMAVFSLRASENRKNLNRDCLYPRTVRKGAFRELIGSLSHQGLSVHSELGYSSRRVSEQSKVIMWIPVKRRGFSLFLQFRSSLEPIHSRTDLCRRSLDSIQCLAGVRPCRLQQCHWTLCGLLPTQTYSSCSVQHYLLALKLFIKFCGLGCGF